MKLDDLISVVKEKKIIGEGYPDVSGISCNSGDTTKGSLFVAIKGNKFDGHSFIKDAVAKGARVVVVEDVPHDALGATIVAVPDSRLALAQIAARFYGNPSSDLALIGITGTNGKTTTAYLVESIFKAGGAKSGVIGTIDYHYGDKLTPAPMTTPESLDIQKMLREMADDGVTHVVAEVSSHALDLKRVDSLHFNAGVFTNLTQDHLDYHKTMDNYYKSKARLFNQLLPQTGSKKDVYAIVNMDDHFGRRLVEDTVSNIIGYGIKTRDQVFPEHTRITLEGISANINTPRGRLEIKSPLMGEFNLYNILAAISVGISQDISLEDIKRGIEALDSVSGRFERIENRKSIHVIVDYAHTSDALERTLVTLNTLSSGRIITVFGCGGDRDRLKRPLMGGISGKYSDLSIVTSDNPRTEDPDTIICEIEEGLKRSGVKKLTPSELIKGSCQKGYIAIVNRGEAIRYAIDAARAQDTVLIAGKGHEDYQIVGEKRITFDDRQEARNVIAEKEKRASLGHG